MSEGEMAWLWKGTRFDMKGERERWKGKREFLVVFLLFTPLGQSGPWLTAGDQWTSWTKKNTTINAEASMSHTDKLKGSQENWQLTWAILVVSLCIVINYFQCCSDYCWAHLCHIPDTTVGSSYWVYKDGRMKSPNYMKPKHLYWPLLVGYQVIHIEKKNTE